MIVNFFLKNNIFKVPKTFYSTRISSILNEKEKYLGNTLLIKGWIKSIRKMKNKIFIDLNDGTCLNKIQVVIQKNEASSKLRIGSSVTAKGILKNNSFDNLEINADTFELIGEFNQENDYPFPSKKTFTQEYTRQFLHLRPKLKEFSSLLRVRHGVVQSIHKYFDTNGYYCVNTPILTSNDCEGAGEMFTIRPDNEKLIKSMNKNNEKSQYEVFFNSKTFLTVSGQLHLEAVANSLSKVYNLGPIFRAENSKSRFHLSEFYMLEVEKAFLNNLEELLNNVEIFLKTITKNMLDGYSEDIEAIRGNNNFEWIDKKFVIITYKEALEILKKHNQLKSDRVIHKEQEHFLVEYNNGVPVFIINWPKTLKPFYMKSCSGNDVAAFDLLAPNIGELFGGSLREDNYQILKENIINFYGKYDENLNWYLDLRKYGGVPTGGYGMGFERYLQMLLNIQNIKDTIPFPRWPHNCNL